MSLTIFQKGKKAFLDYKKQKVKKVKNWDFSKGDSPWFLVKYLKIFYLFIFGKIREENVFDDILERKKAFLDHKKEKVQKVKNCDFSKRGQSMVLIKKLKNFYLFIFGKIRDQNVFDDILERKKAFLDQKKEKVNKVKHCDFSKGDSPWF